jgi:hypothetical protein
LRTHCSSEDCAVDFSEQLLLKGSIVPTEFEKLMSLMSRVMIRCPGCGVVMPNTQFYAGKPWTCSACARQFRIARWYLSFALSMSVVLTIVVCFLSGFRGFRLLAAAIVAFVPVDLGFTYIFNRIVSPPLKLIRTQTCSRNETFAGSLGSRTNEITQQQCGLSQRLELKRGMANKGASMCNRWRYGRTF